MSDSDQMTAEYAMNPFRISFYSPQAFQQMTKILENRITATKNAIAAVHSLSSTQSRGHEGSKRVGLRFHRLQIKGRYEDSRSAERDLELQKLTEVNYHLVNLRRTLIGMKDGVGSRHEAVEKIQNLYAKLEPGEHWGPRPCEMLVVCIWNPITHEDIGDKEYKVENEIASISNTSLGSCSDAVPREVTNNTNVDGSTVVGSDTGSSVQWDGASTGSRSGGSSRASSRASSVFSRASSHSSIASSIHSWISGLRK